jgi:CubicO group peptidase (beta-lactamase class C family)
MQQHDAWSEVTERIKRVERGLWLDPSAWSQRGQRATLAERMAFYCTPGLSVAVINRGELEWARGYGVLEAGKPQPVTADSIFQACSISKHVAMLGALRLVQEGQLDLDEDINRYLTTWKLPPNGAWQPRVTLRQLLGHTAGLTQNWYRGFRRGAATPTLLQVLEGQPPANTPPVRCALLPGSEFRYSGSHYLVLQQLMSDRTRTEFPELMQALVFEPLGMWHSSYDQTYPETRPNSTAVGHYLGGEPVHGQWRVIPEWAGAGLWTTAADLAQIACEIQRAHRGQPSRLLRKDVVDEALRPYGSPPTYALGLQLDSTGATQRFGHGGDNIGYKCLTTAYVEQGYGAVVLTNGDDGMWVVQELLHAIADEYQWPEYLPKRTPLEMTSGDAAGIAGRYELHVNYMLSVEQVGGALVLVAPSQPPIELYPVSDHTFATQSLSTEVSFERDAAGVVSEVVLHQEGLVTRARKQREGE